MNVSKALACLRSARSPQALLQALQVEGFVPPQGVLRLPLADGCSLWFVAEHGRATVLEPNGKVKAVRKWSTEQTPWALDYTEMNRDGETCLNLTTCTVQQVKGEATLLSFRRFSNKAGPWLVADLDVNVDESRLGDQDTLRAFWPDTGETLQRFQNVRFDGVVAGIAEPSSGARLTVVEVVFWHVLDRKPRLQCQREKVEVSWQPVNILPADCLAWPG